MLSTCQSLGEDRRHEEGVSDSDSGRAPLRLMRLSARCARCSRCALPLPTGMTFDTATGVFKVMPSATGFFDVTIKVEVDGYANGITQKVKLLLMRVG